MAYCPRCDRPADGDRCPDCGRATHERPRVRTAPADRPFLEDDDPRRPRENLTVAPALAGLPLVTAARYPLSAGRRPLVIATVLLALAPLVVPLVCLWGYGVHHARAAARGDDEPPPVDTWGFVLTSGAFAALAMAPLLAGGVVLLLVTATTVSMLGTVGTAVGVAVALSPVLAVGYLGIALAATVVGTGRVIQAYQEKLFLRVATTGTLAVGALTLGVLLTPVVVGLALATVVLTQSVLGLPLLALVWLVGLAYANLAAASCVGLIARGLADAGVLEPVYEQDTLELTL